MKPHNIVESLIMPACRVMVKTMLGEDAEKVICKMPSSNNTVARWIEMMSEDISSSVCNLLQMCKRFALQIDESTDVSGKAQLMAFVRFSNGTKMLEQFLFCRALIETKGEDIFKCVSQFFVQNSLLWEWCMAVCTDGAPSMTGNVRGFASMAKRKKSKHCHNSLLHSQEALVSKTMGTDLQSILDDVIKMVNFIKVRPVKFRVFEMLCTDMGADHYTLLMHTDVRWPSKGKDLSRVYELRDELRVFFLNQQVKQDFVQLLSDSTWCSKLAYLVDIFDVLNALNLSMQGNKSNILSVTDKLCAFCQKLRMWSHEIESANSVAMFRHAVEVDPGAIVLHDIVIEHLSQLDDKLQYYFPSLNLSDKDWIRNPFHIQVDMSGLQLQEKEQLIDVAADSTVRLKFLEMNLVEFWIMVEKEYTLIDSKAVGILLPFSTTYLCEKAFSAMTHIKIKHRGCLQALENNLRVCLSTTVLARIETLSQSLQSQPSN
ncbi:zinc finger BED domain-containing protein 5-like [Protopterus annectens]|uniref:zinc finger BED domain-containing protein 5-like n=1 Tax=Protopterus annectens TaxID=7888 RepID=UPI001CFB7562|nr:zinc finger BED domain-containing protein 5-like [Protopterus annectens]